jgi:hypothetical protein
MVVARSERRPATPSPVSCIDLDRFCGGCAYNLRTLPVYLDDRTGIPIVRCPECGTIQSANDASTALRPWLHRATFVLLIGWMIAITGAFGLLGLAEGSLSNATLDEFTAPAGSRIQRIGTTITRTWSGSGPLEVTPDYPQYKLILGTMLGCSLAMGFAGGMLAVVAFPHWRKIYCAALVAGLPIAAGVVVALGWNYEAPHLFDWGAWHFGAHAVTQVLGGLAGVVFGRPAARLAARILLPPAVTPKLAYLWLADGKSIPGR